MHTDKLLFVVLNVVGGIAILASYVLWIGHPSNTAGALWGTIDGVPRLLYTVSMLAAAAGYLTLFSYLVVLEPQLDGAVPWNALAIELVLILIPSALWMPLTFEYLDGPSPAVWWMMRVVLFTVAVGTVALASTVVRLVPRRPTPWRTAALAGTAAFAVQTAILDPFVWPLCFPA